MNSANKSLLAAFAILAAGYALPGAAKDVAPLAECVTLSADHQAARFGDQILAVRDGDTHYRIEFGGTCAALHAGSVVIGTNGTSNQLCPTGTKVSSKSRDCTVRKVTIIDAAEFQRYARRPRR